MKQLLALGYQLQAISIQLIITLQLKKAYSQQLKAKSHFKNDTNSRNNNGQQQRLRRDAKSCGYFKTIQRAF